MDQIDDRDSFTKVWKVNQINGRDSFSTVWKVEWTDGRINKFGESFLFLIEISNVQW
jgi:hypothetical protein